MPSRLLAINTRALTRLSKKKTIKLHLREVTKWPTNLLNSYQSMPPHGGSTIPRIVQRGIAYTRTGFGVNTNSSASIQNFRKMITSSSFSTLLVINMKPVPIFSRYQPNSAHCARVCDEGSSTFRVSVTQIYSLTSASTVEFGRPSFWGSSSIWKPLFLHRAPMWEVRFLIVFR